MHNRYLIVFYCSFYYLQLYRKWLMNETNSEDEDGRLDTNLSDSFDDKHVIFRA